MWTDNSKLGGHLGSLPSVLSPSAPALFATYLAFAVAAPARSQEPPQSVVEAARNAHERKANSTKHPIIITNANIGVPYSAPTFIVIASPSSDTNTDVISSPLIVDCNNQLAPT